MKVSNRFSPVMTRLQRKKKPKKVSLKNNQSLSTTGIAKSEDESDEIPITDLVKKSENVSPIKDRKTIVKKGKEEKFNDDVDGINKKATPLKKTQNRLNKKKKVKSPTPVKVVTKNNSPSKITKNSASPKMPKDNVAKTTINDMKNIRNMGKRTSDEMLLTGNVTIVLNKTPVPKKKKANNLTRCKPDRFGLTMLLLRRVYESGTSFRLFTSSGDKLVNLESLDNNNTNNRAVVGQPSLMLI